MLEKSTLADKLKFAKMWAFFLPKEREKTPNLIIYKICAYNHENKRYMYVYKHIYKDAFVTAEICSGTFIVHKIDLSIGLDLIRNVMPFSANLVSR